MHSLLYTSYIHNMIVYYGSRMGFFWRTMGLFWCTMGLFVTILKALKHVHTHTFTHKYPLSLSVSRIPARTRSTKDTTIQNSKRLGWLHVVGSLKS